MKKVLVAVLTLIISVAMAGAGLAATISYKKKGMYEEGSAGTGSIVGAVSFKGTVPPPIMEDLKKGKNFDICSKHPETNKDGVRPRVKVAVKDGKLQNAVVFIEKIATGKPWGDKGGKFHYDWKGCDIVQKMGAIRRVSQEEKKELKQWKKDRKKATKGKSQEEMDANPFPLWTGLDGTGAVLTIINLDTGILHNPHGYTKKGASSGTLFNLPLNEGKTLEASKNLMKFKNKKGKKGDKHFFLQCDNHNWMEADARIVWNPYYSITGADGSFKIDGIPAGKYKVTAWQPYVGATTQEITVAAGEVKADFTLAAK